MDFGGWGLPGPLRVSLWMVTPCVSALRWAFHGVRAVAQVWGPSVGAPGGGRRGPTPPFRVRWACTLGATSPAAAARAHISRLLSKCLTHRAFLQAHDGPRGPEDLQAPPSPRFCGGGVGQRGQVHPRRWASAGTLAAFWALTS